MDTKATRKIRDPSHFTKVVGIIDVSFCTLVPDALRA